MFDIIKETLNNNMAQIIEKLKEQLTKVRTGRASANVIDGVMVDYYGTPAPIKQVGQISTPEARVLQIHPFDKSMISKIEKSILGANLGLTPSNDGNLIRISFPSLTEESRKKQVKEIKKYGEEAKISLRNERREQNDLIKKAEKQKELSEDDSKKYQAQVQEITNSFVKKVDEIISTKEEELLKV